MSDGDRVQDDAGVEQRYCRTHGWTEVVRGRHPEYGPVWLCPDCGYDHGLFRSKEKLIDYDHESALLETGRELSYLKEVADD